MATINDTKTEKEKMLAGEQYLPSSDELTKDRCYCRKVLKEFNEVASLGEQPKREQELLSSLFNSFGENSRIAHNFRCDYGYNVNIGYNTEINYDCVFLDIGKINIGSQVFIGPGVHIYAVNHPLDPNLRKQGWEQGKNVTIEDGVWIGGGAIICPGVTIGQGTTIGAGAVVTKNIPANVLAVGNPAKVIKEITPGEEKKD
ncbi:trimeric LpxA-like protein [Mycotypha africana]|uniref:trimeric LpxA-like protein n=1 Tax=Mycotypha africana TaxID=64632 RepID=UPI002300BBAE|nr:trimeric LpxA-like protein [Mycotypha africana]KAI8967428.1 trimeric LpxA-like protein [Mycotypha africana]